MVELVVAMAVFIMIAPAVVTMILGTYTGTLRAEKRIQAQGLAQQGLEAARSIRDYDWDNLTPGTFGLSNENGYWELSGSSRTIDEYTQTLTISEINSSTKEVSTTISWPVINGINNSFTAVTRFGNWSLLSWLQTLSEEFNSGRRNSVDTVDLAGGAVQLAPLGDFSDFELVEYLNFFGGGDVRDLVVDGNTLYIATKKEDGSEEFIAYDISDISNGNLTELGTVKLDEDCFEIAIYNGYAYVSTLRNNQEVMIIRLADYTKVNSINLPDDKEAYTIFAANDRVYVGTKKTGDYGEFRVYDISNPEMPIRNALGEVEIDADVSDLEVQSGYAYLATHDKDAELAIINLSNYSYVNSVDLPSDKEATALQIINDSLYIAVKNDGSADEFYELDISDPEGNISINGSIEIDNDVLDMHISGKRAYVVTDNRNEEIFILNLEDYSQAQTLNLENNPDPQAVWFAGAYLYLGNADNDQTVEVIGSALSSSNLDLLDFYNADEDYDARSIFIDEDYAYFGTANNYGGTDPEFYIVNIADPQNVILGGSYNVAAHVNQIYVNGNYAYLATSSDSEELVVLDISNKANPTKVATYNIPENWDGQSVAGQENKVYLGTYYNSNNGGKDPEFFILDVSNPTNIQELGSYDVEGSVYGIKISGDRAYLATSNNDQEFLILDISDPSSITEADSYNTSGSNDAYGIFYESNTVYLTTANNSSNPDFYVFDVTESDNESGTYLHAASENNDQELQIIDPDRSRPSIISLIGSADLQSNNWDVFVEGDLAYVGTSDAREALTMVDISVPTAPTVSQTFNVGSDVNAVWPSNDYIFLATDDNAQEFQVLGEQVHTDYVPEGTFTSSVFGTQSSPAGYVTLTWTQSGTGNILFQIRTADTKSNLDKATWIGQDGTDNTYYDVSGSAIILDPQRSGTQLLQYQATLQGSGSATPILEDVTIEYVL